MFFDLSAEDRAFQASVHAYFAEVVTPEVRAGLTFIGGERFEEVIRRLGRDGWLGIGFPVKYGGQDLSTIKQMIFANEAERYGLHLPHLTLNTVGPLLVRHGTDEQKERLLPGIIRGEILFSVGYSEPEAGTDLASLRTRAVRDGDEYVVNGHKLFTSEIEHASYIWLAVRTDPDAPKHRGISVLLVPTDAEGFSWSPQPILGGFNTSSTFYEDVRVPAINLVGNENEGWGLITGQLNRERALLFTSNQVARCLDKVTDWAVSTPASEGGAIIDRPWVRANLSEVRARNEYARLVTWRLAADRSDENLGPADAAVSKVFTTENALHSYRLLLDVLGQEAYLLDGTPGAEVGGEIETLYKAAMLRMFGGGANDVLRDMIATTGLGIPRARR